MKEISINELRSETAIAEAISLVWNVFLKYEVPDYTQEGIDEFYKSIHDKEYLNMLTIYAAYQEDKMVGVIATRSAGTHIALFFVEENHHRQGIGKKLFEVVSKQNESEFITVNASPYAVPVYHKLGFHDTDTQQEVNGLKFVPMQMEALFRQ